MAGETIKTEAICLAVHPWSQTSHIVTWLTPSGRIGTIVRGAERPKSFFLGQYDLNYTCEILYYARAHGDLHALRECVPLERRDALRTRYRTLTLAGYCRTLASELTPIGPDAEAWYDLLSDELDRLCRLEDEGLLVSRLLAFELKALHLLGLSPEIEAEEGVFHLRGERAIPVSRAVAAYLKDPTRPVENLQTPLDAARVIGVFYHFHLDCAVDVRRSVLAMISKNERKTTT